MSQSLYWSIFSAPAVGYHNSLNIIPKILKFGGFQTGSTNDGFVKMCLLAKLVLLHQSSATENELGSKDLESWIISNLPGYRPPPIDHPQSIAAFTFLEKISKKARTKFGGNLKTNP